VAGLVGAALGLAQQLFPFFARQAAVVPVGAGVFAAMVEEALVGFPFFGFLWMADGVRRR
jgi:hypothetical protein